MLKKFNAQVKKLLITYYDIAQPNELKYGISLKAIRPQDSIYIKNMFWWYVHNTLTFFVE